MKNIFKTLIATSLFMFVAVPSVLAVSVTSSPSNLVTDWYFDGSYVHFFFSTKVPYYEVHEYTDPSFSTLKEIYIRHYKDSGYKHFVGAYQKKDHYAIYHLYADVNKNEYLGWIKVDSSGSGDSGSGRGSIPIVIDIDSSSFNNAINDLKTSLGNQLSGISGQLSSILDNMTSSKSVKKGNVPSYSFPDTSNFYPEVEVPNNQRFVDNKEYFADKGSVSDTLPDMPKIPEPKDWEGFKRENELEKDNELIRDGEFTRDNELEIMPVPELDPVPDLIEFERDPVPDLIEFERDPVPDLIEFERTYDFDNTFDFNRTLWFERNHFYDVSD